VNTQQTDFVHGCSPMMSWIHFFPLGTAAPSRCGHRLQSTSFRWEWSEYRDDDSSFSGSRYRSGSGDHCSTNVSQPDDIAPMVRTGWAHWGWEPSYVTTPADPIRGISMDTVYFDDVRLVALDLGEE